MIYLSFPGGSDGKESASNEGDPGKIPGFEDPLEKGMVFLPGEFHGQRRLVGYSPWDHKGLDMTERLSTAQHSTEGLKISSVAQSCLTLCNPMICSMPGLPVHHQLPEFIQTHVH